RVRGRPLVARVGADQAASRAAGGGVRLGEREDGEVLALVETAAQLLGLGPRFGLAPRDRGRRRGRALPRDDDDLRAGFVHRRRRLGRGGFGPRGLGRRWGRPLLAARAEEERRRDD